jgi:hypothetical protein
MKTLRHGAVDVWFSTPTTISVKIADKSYALNLGSEGLVVQFGGSRSPIFKKPRQLLAWVHGYFTALSNPER